MGSGAAVTKPGPLPVVGDRVNKHVLVPSAQVILSSPKNDMSISRSVSNGFTGSATWAIPVGVGILLCSVIGIYMLSTHKSHAIRLIEEDVMVPMRDGVRLHTKVWRSEDPGRYPVVLTRGYNPTHVGPAELFVKAGYVYVGQSTRGHGSSEGSQGVANRYFDDAQDGYDALTWISEQAWCDGKIAMYGKSYWAGTQWLVAGEQHPNLKAIIPQVMNADLWQCGYRCNGTLSLALAANGRAYSEQSLGEINEMGWQDYFRHLPLITLDEQVGGVRPKGTRELWKQYVSHSTYDDYWKTISIQGDGKDGKYNKIRIPVYLMGGWYDYYAGAAFTSFQRLREVGVTKEIRIVMNASDHLNRVVGDREFGSGAGKDEIALATRWLDHVLRGIDNGVGEEPPVKIFVMGLNQWRYENEWPLARTQYTKYYFHNQNGAHHGRMDTLPPGDERPSRYVYDPNNPVPTLGGNHSVIDRNLAGTIRAGAVDQRPNEERHDVLVFTSSPLREQVEVTGPVMIKLFALSSAPDTDFTAKLIDVYPDGTAYNLTEGVIRARFHRSIRENPELLIPGNIYEFTLELQPTSNVFLPGHGIRVHVTSSNFPLWDRNPNTGHPQGMDAETRVAQQTIFHDREYASHIVLPVIPSPGPGRT